MKNLHAVHRLRQPRWLPRRVHSSPDNVPLISFASREVTQGFPGAASSI